MAKADLKWTFSISETERLGLNVKSGLITYAVSGIATSPDGEDSHFVATNNLDLRYPERFKVNWNGSKPRMPKATGHGIADEVTSAAAPVTAGFLLSRGARIAIAAKCKALLGNSLEPTAEEVAAVPADEEDAS